MYYNDDRDILEIAYPTCTSFLEIVHLSAEVSPSRYRWSVVFGWASEVVSLPEHFKLFCYAVEDDIAFKSIRPVVLIYDAPSKCRSPNDWPAQLFNGDGSLVWIGNNEVLTVSKGGDWDEFHKNQKQMVALMKSTMLSEDA